MSDAPRPDQQGPSGWPAGSNLVCLTMISSNHTSSNTGLRAKRRAVKIKAVCYTSPPSSCALARRHSTLFLSLSPAVAQQNWQITLRWRWLRRLWAYGADGADGVLRLRACGLRASAPPQGLWQGAYEVYYCGCRGPVGGLPAEAVAVQVSNRLRALVRHPAVMAVLGYAQ